MTNTTDDSQQETDYIKKLKGFYKLLAIAVFSLILPFIFAFNSSEWTSFIYLLIT
jgi:hypothetical protein